MLSIPVISVVNGRRASGAASRERDSIGEGLRYAGVKLMSRNAPAHMRDDGPKS
jgi:hypothetical protein